jgi:putative tricarboxylic transport membrane protein
MTITRLGALVALATSVALPALAQTAIEDPECIAPAQPGGGFDLTCRVAQAGLEPQLGAPLQVTFMPGGIGAVAFNLFNTTRTDDPSAIVAFSSGSILNLVTGKYGAYSVDDARWVATAGADFGAVIVRADSEYESLSQLMDAFATEPASVVVGAGGSVGSQDWMKGALLLREAGAQPMDMRYVAFDGGGDAIAALLGGSIQVYTGDMAEMAPHIETGQMRILATMAPERLGPPYDAIPTAREEGYDVEWTILRGFYMGKDASDEAYQAWVDAFEAAYETEEWSAVQAERGLLPLDMAGEELEASIRERAETMRQIATEAGLIN